MKEKYRILWYDLSANRHKLNTMKKVQEIVDKTARAGFHSIVLDVKNYTGFVAYPSAIAPHISKSHYDGYEVDGYDLIANVLSAAKPLGLEVHINVNTFSEGNSLYKNGPAFEHPEWQTVYYAPVRVVETGDGQTADIDEVNAAHSQNGLALFTDEKILNELNMEGKVCEIRYGKVVNILNDGAERNSESMYLVGRGDKADWLEKRAGVGTIVNVSKTRPVFKKAEKVKHETNSTFVNPIRDDVQNYELSVIREILDRYDVDGIVLDRARYSNQFADFSSLSKETFEQTIGQTIENWPEDIYEIEYDRDEMKIKEGPLYQKWIKWRAGNIQAYFKRVEKSVHAKNPKLSFSTYVGSWYPLYYSEGVNWGSVAYQPSFDWASSDYCKTGYAETLDFLMTGNYFHEVTRQEAVEAGNPDWHSVEGSVSVASEAVKSATTLYGSLFLKQYKGNTQQFRRAIQAVMSSTDGVMLFDLIYLEKYGWWPLVSEWFHEKT